MMRLRCRLGFHRYVRVRSTDHDLAEPGASPVWTTRCRDCETELRGGLVVSLVVLTAAVGTAIVIFFVLSPLLGAVLMIGAVGGLLVRVGPASLERVAHWLSVGR